MLCVIVILSTPRVTVMEMKEFSFFWPTPPCLCGLSSSDIIRGAGCTIWHLPVCVHACPLPCHSLKA